MSGHLTAIESAALESIAIGPMLDQVVGWANINSGSRNIAGLDAVAGLLAEAFSVLPVLMQYGVRAYRMSGDEGVWPVDTPEQYAATMAAVS